IRSAGVVDGGAGDLGQRPEQVLADRDVRLARELDQEGQHGRRKRGRLLRGDEAVRRDQVVQLPPGVERGGGVRDRAEQIGDLRPPSSAQSTSATPSSMPRGYGL
ncbi:MAG: hypothetical protein ACRDQD_04735, partial [Nocardioidaceae bacterium]